MTEEKKKKKSTLSVCDVHNKSPIRSKSEFPLCFQPLAQHLGLSDQNRQQLTLLILFLLQFKAYQAGYTDSVFVPDWSAE